MCFFIKKRIDENRWRVGNMNFFGYLEKLGFLFKIKARMKILPQAYS
jgi:hypothetical protein